MNVEVDTDDEVNLIKEMRALSNACYKCGEMGHFQRDCKYDGDKPMDGQQGLDRTYDSYDPVVEKWMTNLVATTPITTKVMKSLYAELNRQKELKRNYRQRYPSANLQSHLRDKAKHTTALIQEITEELQAIEEESSREEEDSDATQESDLEQEDSDIQLTDSEQ